MEFAPNCRIAIKKDADLPADKVMLLGQIKVHLSLFARQCDEARVLNFLFKEACSLGGHLINITKERPADFWDTCYRVEADFLRFIDPQEVLTVESDPHYAWPLIEERAKNSRDRESAFFYGVIGGTMSTPMK